MKDKVFFNLMLILLCFVSGSSIGQSLTNNKDLVKMGASQINITPEQPVIMSGYDARKTPSTGVHDSLFASALFFSGEQNKELLITADVIGFPHTFIDSIKKTIVERTGLSADNIMIVALHNHGG